MGNGGGKKWDGKLIPGIFRDDPAAPHPLCPGGMRGSETGTCPWSRSRSCGNERRWRDHDGTGKILDLGTGGPGSGKSRIWECGKSWIWELGKCSIWECGKSSIWEVLDLRIGEILDLGVWEVLDLGIGEIPELEIREILDSGIGEILHLGTGEVPH